MDYGNQGTEGIPVNLNTNEVAWGATPDRDPRNIGNAAANMMNAPVAPDLNSQSFGITSEQYMVPGANGVRQNMMQGGTTTSPNTQPASMNGMPNTQWVMNAQSETRQMPEQQSMTNPEAITPVAKGVELGRIVPAEMSMPPNMASAEPQAPEVVKNTNEVNFSAVRRTAKDNISQSAVNEIMKIEQKLAKDGDLNSFYDEARSMTDAYLDNSYDRKLGGTK